MYLSRDYLRFSAIVDFVMVEDAEGVPLRRVSCHAGKDVRQYEELLLYHWVLACE
jgi:hypothetical protein